MEYRKITLIVEGKEEIYAGEKTGKYCYHARTKECGSLGGVLGRGYTEREAKDDFIRRANMDLYRADYRVKLAD